MAKTLQFRRGTTSELSSVTGSVGELFVNTEKDTIVVMDGSTSGGFELVNLNASQTLTNKTLTSPVISTISNTGTLTLPTSTGTIALTSDIPTNNNQLTNGAGYTTNVGDITNVAVSGTGLSGGGASGSVTITSNATNANTASTIIARDASGNFSAGTITASLTGTASNAALLDSLDSTQFLRSDTADTKTSGDLTFSDSVKANFGAGNDLQIFHDTVNS